jgi:hypothetical protein
MATETRVAGSTGSAGNVEASDDYQAIPRPVRRVDPETRMASSCMIWGVVIGMGALVCMMLWWVFTYLSSGGFSIQLF